MFLSSDHSSAARKRAIIPTAAVCALISGLFAAPSAVAGIPLRVTLTGDFVDEATSAACADWAPSCETMEMIPAAGAPHVFEKAMILPAGSWQYKVKSDAEWVSNIGQDNMEITVAADTEVVFQYDSDKKHIGVKLPNFKKDYTEAENQALIATPARRGTGESFYFVLTDRFANGTSSNDNGGLESDPMVSGFDPQRIGFYHGGDIQGLRDKLSYIKNLGTTAIWMTPSFKNEAVQGAGESASAGYHGYWITDFTQIDPHLGTKQELQDLITEAHAQGIKVYFDVILNHTADLIAFDGYANSPAYKPTTERPYTDAEGNPFDIMEVASSSAFPELNADSFPYTPRRTKEIVPAELNDVTLYHNRGDGDFSKNDEGFTLGDFYGLDDLMTENPRVVSALSRIYSEWASTGIDGFRIDTVKHVNFQFWKDWTKVIDESGKATNPNFFMFGEVYNRDVQDLSPYSRETSMGATLDFAYQNAVLDYLKGGSTESLAGLFAADDMYTTPTSSAMDQPTFLGNHDMGRIGFMLGGTGNELERVALGHEMMFLTRGQPVVYYGDEQGFIGEGGDKHARQSLFASQVDEFINQNLLTGERAGSQDRYDENSRLYTTISKVARLRDDHPALKNGEQIELYKDSGPGVYAFARVDTVEKTEYVVAVNNTGEQKSATFSTLTPGARYQGIHGANNALDASDGTVTVLVPAFGAVVYKADRAVAPAASASTRLDIRDGAALTSQTRSLDGQPNIRFALAPVSASLPEMRWGQTSFWWRTVGEGDDAWKQLGVDTGEKNRVFQNVEGIKKGALIEYRAVSIDAAGVVSADAAYASVNLDQQAVDTESVNPFKGSVTIPGTHSQALGCSRDWAEDCLAGALDFDEKSGWYSKTFTLPAGGYDYKIALDGSWKENYGVEGSKSGVFGGKDSHYHLDSETAVTFYYNPTTHEFYNTAQRATYTLPGEFGSHLGCEGGSDGNGSWNPACRATLMGDADGDGIFTYETVKIPVGHYRFKVAENLEWTVSHGCPAGSSVNCEFDAEAGKLIVFHYKPSTQEIWVDSKDPTSDVKFQTHWLDSTTFAWPTGLGVNGSWKLYWAKNGGMQLNGSVVTGADGSIDLRKKDAGLTQEQRRRDPHLRDHTALEPVGALPDIQEILKGEVRVLYTDPSGIPLYYSGVQIPRVLDSLYAQEASQRAQGVSFNGDGTPHLSLWAPTAHEVSLELFDAPDASGSIASAPAQILAMTAQSDGSWTIDGDATWMNRPYRYKVKVYIPEIAVSPYDSSQTALAGTVVENSVTDPNSTALAIDSTHSVIANLADDQWKPEGWPGTPPRLANFSQHAIYELHVRDFSISDTTVPEDERGTYAAFTRADSAGMQHLKRLSDAGMNTIHLLPTNDIGSIPERREDQAVPAIADGLPADSSEQQSAVGAVKDEDGFNWGYDPYHYTTPEGSYATAGHQYGAERTKEYRSMVGALHGAGYQVILDQVFNHTFAQGQDGKSVFEKIVPGYYHRLSCDGTTLNTPCCAETASEHAMMEDLMVDSLVTWAKTYKVDGFRFDLMGFHSRPNMERIRAALDELTLETDGVDGKRMYLYGEGWNFGSVQDNARFVQARQGNLAGTGIGSFNDRLRDGVHGHGNNKYLQGFGNGLWSDPNAHGQGGGDDAKNELQNKADLIRIGLAGNLMDYGFYNYDGTWRKGGDMNGAGYALEPHESVNYIDAHDNETLYDFNAWALPQNATMDTRVRMNTLSLATVALGQSPMFWHAGTDILRSKSLDRNSYNSGDHFNRVDWTRQTSNFGVGLPPEWDNNPPSGSPEEQQWSKMREILANSSIKPDEAAMTAAHTQAIDLLKLRSSSPLFTLGTADLIKERVTFPDAGTYAEPGLILMRITDPGPDRTMRAPSVADIDPDRDEILVAFNATPNELSKSIDALKGLKLELSEIQHNGADETVKSAAFDSAQGKVTVPARTVAVFEARVVNQPPTVVADPAENDVPFGSAAPELMAGITASDPEDGPLAAAAVATKIMYTDAAVGAAPVEVAAIDTRAVGRYEVTYTATDSKGAAGTAVRVYTVKKDMVAPTLTVDPERVEVEVGGPAPDLLAGVAARDDVDGANVTITPAGDVDMTKLGENTVSYTATDQSGNTCDPMTRTYVVVDRTKPRVAVAPSSVGLVVGADAPNLMNGVAATDNVDGNIDPSKINTVVEDPGNVLDADGKPIKPGSFTVTYTVKDSSGNESAPVIRTYVVSDEGAPVISVDPASIVLAVGDPIPSDFKVGVSAFDEVDGVVDSSAITATLSDPQGIASGVTAMKPGSFTVTYSVKDAAGNAAQPRTRTYVVKDVKAPVISVDPASIVLAVGDPIPSDFKVGVSAFDEVDGVVDSSAITATLSDPQGIASGVTAMKPGSFTVTYSVKDAAGNAAQPRTRTYTVSDTGAPVITVDPARVELAVADPLPDFLEGVSAADDVDGQILQIKTTVSGVASTDRPGEFTVVYTATDAVGNVATASRTYAVVDKTAPVITVDPEEVSLQVGESLPNLLAGVSATDDVDFDVTVSTAVDGEASTAAPGRFEVVYSAVDTAGNAATDKRRVYIVKDVKAPVISVDPASIVLAVGDPIPSDFKVGVSAFDEVDGVVDSSAITATLSDPQGIASGVTAMKPGSFTVTYSVKDAAGNEGTAVRGYSVSDQSAPVISVVPDAVEVASGQMIDPLEGVSAHDDVDGPIVDIVVEGGVGTAPGQYVVTYSAVDSAGHRTAASRTYTVVDKTTPVISVNPQEMTIEAGGDAPDLLEGVSAVDTVDGEVPVTTNDRVDHLTPGITVVTYSAVDKAGNAAPSATRIYRVVDTTPPTIEVAPGDVVLEYGAPTPNPLDGVKTSDNSGRVQTVSVIGAIDTRVPGVHAVMIAAIDASGNRTEVERRFIVADKTALQPQPGLWTPGMPDEHGGGAELPSENGSIGRPKATVSSAPNRSLAVTGSEIGILLLVSAGMMLTGSLLSKRVRRSFRK